MTRIQILIISICIIFLGVIAFDMGTPVLGIILILMGCYLLLLTPD